MGSSETLLHCFTNKTDILSATKFLCVKLADKAVALDAPTRWLKNANV